MKAVNFFKALLLVFVIVGIGAAPTQAQTLSDYSALPPFLEMS